jgi:flagellin
LTDLFNVTNAGGKLKFEAKTAGANGESVTNVAFSADTGAANTLALTANDVTETAGLDAYNDGTNGYVNVGTTVISTSEPGESDQLASTSIDLSGKLTDGAKITLGKETYTIAVGDKSAFANEKNVVKVDENATDAQIASELTQVAANNTYFTVGHDGSKLTLKQRAEVKADTDFTTIDKLAAEIGISTVDTTDGEATAAQALTLQIGDTANTYNKLTVSVDDMHAASLGIDGLNIADQNDASTAIDIIKNAINQVSSTRGTLGATQNRLEHTSNNLSVMTENIQDAESTIRDTDIAEEMMSYTKNNILVQSAQAMLAQANSVPQGVLQLLQ